MSDIKLYAAPDGFGEATIWRDDENGLAQPVIAYSDLSVGSRYLWPELAARLTGEKLARVWLEGHAAGRDYQGDGWNSDAHDPNEDNPYRAAEVDKG